MSLSGLEHLMTIDQLHVKHIVAAFNPNKQYEIKDNSGEIVYRGCDDMEFWDQCCTSKKSIMISDTQGNQAIHLTQESVVCCKACCYPHTITYLHVYAPPGNLIGTVEHKLSFPTPKFDVKNADGDIVLKLGYRSLREAFGNPGLKILSLDKSTQIGTIRERRRRGIFDKSSTMPTHNHASVSFPSDLDVKMKAVLLGACFLIDNIFYKRPFED